LAFGAMYLSHLVSVQAIDGNGHSDQISSGGCGCPVWPALPAFRDVRIWEIVAQAAAADFAWPAPFTMEMQSCGHADAAWADKTRTVRVCYELAFDFCSALSRLCRRRAYAGIGQSKAKAKIEMNSPSALLALTRIDVINSCSASV
jgi:hypothetical protein